MTDISVQIVDSSKDLVAEGPYPEGGDNECDPLAIHDGAKEEGGNEMQVAGEETVACDDTKEVCTPESQNDVDSSVLADDDTNDGTLMFQEVNGATYEIVTADSSVLDANAPTPDLPDDLTDYSPGNDNEQETEGSQPETSEIAENAADMPNEIEEKLKELEAPMQIETNASSDLPIQTYEEIPESDLIQENKIEENCEQQTEMDTDAETLDEESSNSNSVEEKVRKLFGYSLSEAIDTVAEKEYTEETEINSEKSVIVPIKSEAAPEKVLTESAKPDTVLEKTETVAAKNDSALDKIKTVIEKTTTALNKTEVLPNKIGSKIDSSDMTGMISSKTANLHLEKSVSVQDNTKKAASSTETVSEKAETVPEYKKVTSEEPKAFKEKFNYTEIKEPVVEKTEVPEKVQMTPENPEKMDVDPENLDGPSDKIRVKNFDSAENKTSKNGEPVNGDIDKKERSSKRRASDDVEESPLKKLCQEVEKNFPHHDAMINEYIQCTTKNNIDEIQKHTEQLLAEIQTLRELAQKKEQEWNNILHLKKVKEEILLRLLRNKQVLSFEKSLEINGSSPADPFDYLNQSKNLAIDKSDEISGLSIKQPGSSSVLRQCVSPINPIQSLQNAMAPMSVLPHFNPMSGLPPPYDKAAAAHMQSMSNSLQSMTNNMQTMSNNMQNMSKGMPSMPMGNSMPSMSNSMQNLQNMSNAVYQPMMMPGPMPGFPRDINAMNGQMQANFGMPMGRQGPTKDVKSIIADYRQRNPDVTPRRGRRMKSILNPNMMNAPRNMAPKDLNNFNMLFNNLDMNQKAMLERLQQLQVQGLPNSIFKDALVQFASMQQAGTSAGLHARTETAVSRPEPPPKERRRVEREAVESPRPPSAPRQPPPPYPEISLLPVTTHEPPHPQSLLHGILTKNCGEITITPVQPAAEPQPQPQPQPQAQPQPQQQSQPQQQTEKPEEVVQLQDDEESPAPSETEAADSPAGGGGRLVIDEPAEETPLCQGCRRRDAQFVCAGCANQWYCSRDCQVAAWDEHSDMCSG